MRLGVIPRRTARTTKAESAGRRWLCLVGVTVVVLLAGTGGAVAGQGDLVSPLAGPASNALADEWRVTLITGDQVTVRRGPTGQYDATAEAAPRPDGTARITFTTLRSPQGDLYVFPSDAEASIANGVLDRQLFNVAHLVEEGLADPATGLLPAIVAYRERASETKLAQQADALPATSDPVRSLGSINGAAVGLRNSDLDRFWNTIRPKRDAKPKASSSSAPLAAGVERVWLDDRVEAALDESVPQIGAPAAWQRGLDGSGVKVAILDTGIDENHPDFAGKVVDSRSFIPNQAVQDGHGHGTHVASIVTGSGAASGGRFRGVAPGVQLLIGKVLGNGGSGSDSGVIEGMEWAAANGAGVVSMSLGSDRPSDGQDPVSLAVDELTETTGSLFVIAAGNSGPAAQTVAAPGAAKAALTVGAVDKQDALAGFSSRGPLIDSLALKPDLTAPGVAIGAARAAGTSIGTPIDAFYTRLSGTSMATPHVSGAAAILAQQHPDWDADELKSALTGSAQSAGPIDTYQRGSGSLDVADAINQTLLASPSSIDFGPLSESVARTVTITNVAEAPATVTLSADVHGPDGEPADGVVQLSQTSLALPAGGTADVTASFTAPGESGFGGYTGLVRALDTAGAEVLRIALGASKQPPSHDLTLESIPPDEWGNGILDFSHWFLLRVDAPQDPIVAPRAQREELRDGVRVLSTTVRVPDGVYMIRTTYTFYDEPTGQATRADLVNPEVVVDGAPATVLVDGRRAKPIHVRTPRPAEPIRTGWKLVRGTTFAGPWVVIDGLATFGRGTTSIRVTPTGPVQVGGFRFVADYHAIEPRGSMRLLGAGKPELHPMYPDYFWSKPQLQLHRTVELVDVGAASPDEIGQAEIDGRLALYEATTTECLDDSVNRAAFERLEAAGALGAIAFRTSRSRPIVCANDSYGSTGFREAHRFALPVLVLGNHEGQTLRGLAQRRELRARVDTTERETYSYHLRLDHSDRVPDTSALAVKERDLVTVDSTYHADGPAWIEGNWSAWDREGVGFTPASRVLLEGAGSRTEYLYPATPDMIWQHETRAQPLDPAADFEQIGIQAVEHSLMVLDERKSHSEHWLTPPRTPGSTHFRPDVRELVERWRHDSLGITVKPLRGSCICRGPLWLSAMREDVAGGYRQYEPYLLNDLAGLLGNETHLYLDGQELAPSFPGAPLFDTPVLPAGPARYRLTQRHRPFEPLTRYPSQVDTTWEFTSQAPAENETFPGLPCVEQGLVDPTAACRVERLLFLAYDLSDDLGLDNTARAPGQARVEVRVYQQEGAPRSRAKGLKLEVSFDGGKSWQKPKKLASRGNGLFEASLKHPRLRETGGTVSMRAEAWDDAGNRVQQTLLDAYGLRGTWG